MFPIYSLSRAGLSVVEVKLLQRPGLSGSSARSHEDGLAVYNIQVKMFAQNGAMFHVLYGAFVARTRLPSGLDRTARRIFA